MKRLVLFCLSALLLTCVSLSATDIRSIHTDVYLHKNGNAVVYQRWDVTITGGTEWYIPVQDMGQRSIRSFRVFRHQRRRTTHALPLHSTYHLKLIT